MSRRTVETAKTAPHDTNTRKARTAHKSRQQNCKCDGDRGAHAQPPRDRPHAKPSRPLPLIRRPAQIRTPPNNDDAIPCCSVKDTPTAT